MADVYSDKKGKEFSDALLVHLPKDQVKRKAIRRVCGQLRRCKLGTVQPERDIGEIYLFLSLT